MAQVGLRVRGTRGGEGRGRGGELRLEITDRQTQALLKGRYRINTRRERDMLQRSTSEGGIW
jgi:hypothetical protein